MNLCFMRLDGKDFTHIQAYYVTCLFREGRYRPIVECRPNPKGYKFILYGKRISGQGRVRSFSCYGDLVKVDPKAKEPGFKMILPIAGSGHYDVVRLVDPSKILKIPAPTQNLELARKNMIDLTSDEQKVVDLHTTIAKAVATPMLDKMIILSTKTLKRRLLQMWKGCAYPQTWRETSEMG